MTAYIFRRLLLIVPTLVGILTINFIIIQIAPGGPIDQMIAEFNGMGVDATARISGIGVSEVGSGDQTGGASAASDSSSSSSSAASQTRGSHGFDPQLIEELKQQYGFDKPLAVRYVQMLWDYARFNFGESFFSGRGVWELILDKLPVSISLGLWTTLLAYLVSIPLGIAKAVRDGSRFDLWTSALIIIGNAVPSFLFAILLVVLFAGGSYVDWFPLRGLVSNDWEEMVWWRKILDYFWHLTLPLTAMMIGAFASLTLLTKNSFIDEISKQYVITARAKGATERQVLYGHVFRNAMLIVIAGFPGAFIGIFLGSSLLIEVIFSLDGLGLLGYESALKRDYPIMFSTLYIFTLLGLIMNLVADLMYMFVDPRIDFESRQT